MLESLENKQNLINYLERRKIRHNIVQELLYRACRKGKIDIVQLLVGKVNLEGLTHNKWRPIHLAAKCGQLEIVQFLLKNNVDPRPLADSNILPIHLAIRFGHLEIVKILISYEVLSPFLFNLTFIESIKYKRTKIFKFIFLKLLETEFKKENIEIPCLLREFLEKGNNFRLLEKLKENSNVFEYTSKICYDILTDYIHAYPLDVLSQYCNREIAEIIFFLTNKFFRKQKISKRIISLRYIIRKDNVKMIDLYIKYNIVYPLFVNGICSQNEIVRYAFIFKSLRIIRYLLDDLELREKFQIGKYISYINNSSIDKFINFFIEYNLNLESANDAGVRLIHYVCRNGKSSSFNLLADKVDLNAVDNRGKGVLHHACENYNLEIVKELMKRKININLKDYNEYTPFNIACECGFIEIVKLLLENGASIDSPSHISSLCIACRSSNNEIVKLLLEKGLDPNFSCNKTLPIHIACYNKNIELIKILLSKTRKIDVIDDNGLTPLSISFFYNHLDMVKLVVDGFISEKIYRITLLSDIFSVDLNRIGNPQILEYIQSKIEVYRKTLFSSKSSDYQDIVIKV